MQWVIILNIGSIYYDTPVVPDFNSWVSRTLQAGFSVL